MCAVSQSGLGSCSVSGLRQRVEASCWWPLGQVVSLLGHRAPTWATQRLVHLCCQGSPVLPIGGPLKSISPFFWVHVLMLMKHITLEPPRKGAWGWLGKIWRHCIYLTDIELVGCSKSETTDIISSAGWRPCSHVPLTPVLLWKQQEPSDPWLHVTGLCRLWLCYPQPAVRRRWWVPAAWKLFLSSFSSAFPPFCLSLSFLFFLFSFFTDGAFCVSSCPQSWQLDISLQSSIDNLLF